MFYDHDLQLIHTVIKSSKILLEKVTWQILEIVFCLPLRSMMLTVTACPYPWPSLGRAQRLVPGKVAFSLTCSNMAVLWDLYFFTLLLAFHVH